MDYTYAIHEAYYDKKGHVGAITEDPVEPCGENIEELRRSWIMMAEAFGQPILDYDNIPEPGYRRKKDPMASVLDKRLKQGKTGSTELISWEEIKSDLEERCGPIDEEGHRKRIEEERIEKETIHGKVFVGTPTIEELIDKIQADYREYIKGDRTQDRKYGKGTKRASRGQRE